MMTDTRVLEARQGAYLISTDPTLLDLDAVHGALNRTYWGAGRPRELVAQSLAHSLCFGLYHEQAQVGLARVVTDHTTFAWLCDVYILEEHRGNGLGKWLIATVVSHPDLRAIRRIMLATRDAHGLYQRYGFRTLSSPDRWMERSHVDQTVEPGERG
ncbi:MAG: GNAT family N-acetyltransferase [Chloroflexales bacterium]|nr:GNAT family N-acetyltransferase [Chloroflexales bacterium]